MFFSRKKFLGVILISGLLLAALLHSWSPQCSSAVYISHRRPSEIKNILERVAGPHDYHDIAYHVKEDVASWVTRQNFHICRTFDLFFLFQLSQCLLPHFDEAFWLKTRVCVRPTRTPSSCRGWICCFLRCGPWISPLLSWSLKPNPRV